MLFRLVLSLIGVILIAWMIFAQLGFKFRTSDEEAIKEFAKNGVTLITGTSVVKDHHLHYAVTGSDSLPSILFIHGSPGSWDAFARYMQDSVLLRKYRMISIDRPGFGYSDFGIAENLQSQSDLISVLIRALKNGKPMYLVGHSLGGPMIVKLAANNPSLFSGLVVLAGSMDPALEDKESWRPALFSFPLKYLVPGAMRPSNEELWYLKNDLVALAHDFSAVTCPVYLVHGDRDNMVPLANTEYSKKMLVNSPKVELKILAGANHFIPWMRYDEIREVLLKLELQ